MITQYHRPDSLEEALTLLEQPDILPMGGGTLLSQTKTDSIEVVDLQRLGMDALRVNGNELQIGAVCTLQSLLESEHVVESFKTALKLEAPLNIRNSASAAGTLAAGDGRSTFATAMLALDARLELYIHKELNSMGVSEFLLTRPKCLITNITIPLNIKFTFETVSKTPADTPLICAAMTQWPSGRTRFTLGGYGKSPLLAMDGTEADGAETAARNAYHEAHDEFASAEYRMDAAATLAKRCLAMLSA